MLLAIEGAAGAGKTTVRDRLIGAARQHGYRLSHAGQFSWLSPAATRVLVALRAGHPPAAEATAVEAVRRDLELHARHNLGPARDDGHVVADRLVLSGACLLALYYGGPVGTYLDRLAAVGPARPEVTFVLDTPPTVCARRVAARPTGPRPVERPHAARRLADLYAQAADAWADLTGGVVWRHPATEPSDTDLLVAEALELLRTGQAPVDGALARGRR